jgi:hypothetical protein
MSTFFIFKFFSVETIIIVGVHYFLILADDVGISQHMHVILSEVLNRWKNKLRLVRQKWNYDKICVEHLETTHSVDLHSPHETLCLECKSEKIMLLKKGAVITPFLQDCLLI